MNSELNITDNLVFEREVQRRVIDPDAPYSLFILDMSATSKIFARSGSGNSAKFQRLAATLLRDVCREQDRIYRIGDDTFGLLLADIQSPVHQQLAAEKITRLHNDAIRDMDAPFKTAVRIGIANYPEHADNAVDLIRKANIALESTHAAGEAYLIFSAESVATLSLKWDLQEEVGAAIEGQAFELYYQPKISMATGRTIGAEALLRWNSCERGSVPPDVFIPVACDIGMMNELSKFVLTTALRQASEWPDNGERFSISVNVEADALQDIDIVDAVRNSLLIWRTDDRDLILEITESALVEDSKSSFRCLKELRAMGVGISIDDFGTGYSSLSYFKNIQATELKIDKSFVACMLDSARDRNMVEAIIWLAHRFDLSVVAEGVENIEQLNALKKLGCDVVQGFYYAEPMPQDEFVTWLGKRRVDNEVLGAS